VEQGGTTSATAESYCLGDGRGGKNNTSRKSEASKYPPGRDGKRTNWERFLGMDESTTTALLLWLGSIMIADSPEASTKILGKDGPAVNSNSGGVCNMLCKKSTVSAEVNKHTLAFKIGVSSMTVAAATPCLGGLDWWREDRLFFFLGEMNLPRPFFLVGDEHSANEDSIDMDATDLLVDEDDSYKVDNGGG
jgi:hypothetical protein